MRLKIDVAKAYLIGCTLLTWGLTACIGDMMPTQAPADPGYELIHRPTDLARGMIKTQILNGDGQEIFASTYDAAAYANSASITLPSFATSVDSMNIRAIGSFLVGKGNSSSNNGTVKFVLKGHEISIQVLQRGAKGEAQSFKIKLKGDTTLVVTTPSNAPFTRQFQLTAGSQVLYSGSSSIGRSTAAGSANAVIPEDEATCLERFGIIAAELAAGIYGIIDGLIGLDAIEIIAGFTLFFNSWIQLLVWIAEDCPNTFANWLRNFWIENCQNPLFSWTPFCEE